MNTESQQPISTTTRFNSTIHCERVILGALILDDDCWEGISKTIDERDFIFEAHRLIFHAIRMMRQGGVAVTVNALRKIMQAQQIRLPGKSIPRSLEEIVASAKPGAYAIVCANILKSRDAQYAEFIGDTHTGCASGFMCETSLLVQLVDDLEMAHKFVAEENDTTSWLDDITSYLKTKNLIVLMGHNEQRNFILASNLVYQFIFKQGIPCGVFCQDAKEFLKGQLALASEVGIKKLHTGELSDDGWNKVVRGLGLINGAPLFLERLPTSFELLKKSIRRYANRCEKESSSGKNSPAFVFNLHRLLGTTDHDGLIPFAQAMHELNELSISAGVPVILVHHARGEDAQADLDSIIQCADVVFTLGSPAVINENLDNLVIHIKGDPLPSKVRLSFDSEMFTVKPELVYEPSAD